ncbi:hypothetical protein NDU88_008251 [Pleurodeles waltl]|uniref:Uncharacterized protein n=1 Tax=Pleurodeles waltl TaxID=8319 RepID=A0AAV7RSL4_PLEWA|nr:hypothetical protein NDU88_008251 [Pleurodeles waltl]
MLLACSRRKEAGRKPPIGSMRVRTHGQQKRTASSERASARSHGLLPLHYGNEGLDYSLANREKPYFILGRYA